MSRTYYIDGYNVIHHSTLLRPIAMENFERAREALVEKVSRFCAATGSEAKIVFDGRGRSKDSAVPKNMPGIEIIYSPGHITADALIERVVYNAPDRRALIIVSADRGIRNICGNLNALIMQPDNFLNAVHESEGETRATLEHMRKPDTQKRVEERLDEKSLDMLQKLREKLAPPEKEKRGGEKKRK
jgi:predicted RNA-binding protein with PIN domain